MTVVVLLGAPGAGKGTQAGILKKRLDIPHVATGDLFRAAVQTWPEVVECAAMTGEMDYLLRVLVQDMQHYARFISDTLQIGRAHV